MASSSLVYFGKMEQKGNFLICDKNINNHLSQIGTKNDGKIIESHINVSLHVLARK